MPNKTSAMEWLMIAYHDLKSAKILLEANHYTDCICEIIEINESELK
ncbi:MAG: hypothetical protein U9P72_03865 [Campylobacterota bacterium]|nr:hypothetical protein [Campylobacterota bacterium]